MDEAKLKQKATMDRKRDVMLDQRMQDDEYILPFDFADAEPTADGGHESKKEEDDDDYLVPF